MKRHWQLQEAKARLSEVVKTARKEGPQEITVRGEPAAVVVSHRDYRRLSGRKPSFVDFIRKSPLSGVNLELDRDKSPVRRVSL